MDWRELIAPAFVPDTLMGVAFVSREPRRRRAAVALEAREILFMQRAQLGELDAQIAGPRLMRRTRDRLKALRDATERHLHVLEGLFAAVEPAALAEASHALGQAKAGFPLLRYWGHLFRDWSWGESETQASLALAKKVLPDAAAPERVLALGAGACRFPYELHRWRAPQHTLCVDLSPLLLSCAARLVRGEKLELVEFPFMPGDTPDQAVTATLSCAAPITQGFDVLVNDLEEWALKDGAFDLVVTHWVIDAVPLEPERLFSLINRALAPKGRWLNVGPLGFNRRTVADNYGRDEVVAVAERCELPIVASEVARVPYFQNPRSAAWRTEQVFAFVAEKRATCAEVAPPAQEQLPAWLEDTKQPVALAADPAELARSYRFCSELLEHVAKGASVDQLVAALAPKHGLTAEQAEQLIGGTLVQWVDLGRRNLLRD